MKGLRGGYDSEGSEGAFMVGRGGGVTLRFGAFSASQTADLEENVRKQVRKQYHYHQPWNSTRGEKVPSLPSLRLAHWRWKAHHCPSLSRRSRTWRLRALASEQDSLQ